MSLSFITFCLAHSEERIIYTLRSNKHLFITDKDKVVNMTSEIQKEFTRETTDPEL